MLWHAHMGTCNFDQSNQFEPKFICWLNGQWVTPQLDRIGRLAQTGEENDISFISRDHDINS